MTGEDKKDVDTREIVIRLKVYELRMMMEALKGHPWKFAHPVLLSCDAQLKHFENVEKDTELRQIRSHQKQRNAEVEALARKKADEMFKIKITELEEKEKKRKSRRRRKSRR